ncbi:MAG: phosphoesterase, partial [Acidimicrobiales bacterium]|nr:phosphoesterase [Acidimicrobiales bacterium]
AVSQVVSAAAPSGPPAAAVAKLPARPPARHLFLINLENKGFDTTFGPTSVAPYLSKTLRGQGALLTQYFGTAHNSLPNYIAQISGQAPNPQTQGDCQVFSPFVGAGTVAPGQAVGDGCVYPASVRTVADQLDAAHLSWKGYDEDMGTPCRHPAIGAVDDTQKARPNDQYAVRHNPFVYFHSIIDSPRCGQRVLPLERLTSDLGTIASTANLSVITPDLCSDGHDAPCVDGRPGGLVSADAFLRAWVPRILASPAYKKDGVLVITFDESDSPQSDASACCGEGPGPNSPLPGITGMGGGRVGAVVLSRWVTPGTTSTTPYNHYGLLRTFEDIFGLPYLGDASSAGVHSFGRDVFTHL